MTSEVVFIHLDLDIWHMCICHHIYIYTLGRRRKTWNKGKMAFHRIQTLHVFGGPFDQGVGFTKSHPQTSPRSINSNLQKFPFHSLSPPRKKGFKAPWSSLPKKRGPFFRCQPFCIFTKWDAPKYSNLYRRDEKRCHQSWPKTNTQKNDVMELFMRIHSSRNWAAPHLIQFQKVAASSKILNPEARYEGCQGGNNGWKHLERRFVKKGIPRYSSLLGIGFS